MKTILAFIGSPRNLGNCEIMAKEMGRHFPEGWELKMLRLTDFDIRPCRGCYFCLFGDGNCVLKDDFPEALSAILAADAYIAIAPTYFLGVPSVFKRLTDRGLALYPHAETLWGRPAIGVGVAGIPDRQGSTELGLESFLKLLLADLKGVRMVFGALPGEIFMNPDNKAVARSMAESLFAPAPAPAQPCCPVCGGRTFRFLDGGRARCMLCSNPGRLTLRDGVPAIEIEKGAHEMFTSLEAAVAHREWLRGMKARFLAERGALKQITGGYRKEGAWVRPK